jgi:O-antigen/teichoic acid export membrane protein
MIPVVISSALYPFRASESAGSRAGLRVAGLMSAAGGVIAILGVALAPFLVPFIFGSKYTHAVLVVQVMIVVIPFVFAANPRITHIYTARLEHHALGIALAAVSFVGSAAIVAGQVLVGPVAAAGGFLSRSVLVVAVLAAAGRRRAPFPRSAISEQPGLNGFRERGARGERSTAPSRGSA